MGIDFGKKEPRALRTFFRRRAEFLRWQQMVLVYTDADVLCTKDLWIKQGESLFARKQKDTMEILMVETEPRQRGYER